MVGSQKKAPDDEACVRIGRPFFAQFVRRGVKPPTHLVKRLTDLGLIEAVESGGNFTVKIPKLKNYMDEYMTRKAREEKAENSGDSPRRKESKGKENKRKESKGEAPVDLAPEGHLPAPSPEEQIDPERDRAAVQKLFKLYHEQTDKPKAVPTPVEPAVKEEHKEPDQGQGPQPVDPELDPELEAELGETRADIIGAGFDPARANQIICLLAEYHSGRLTAYQLSDRLGTVVSQHEKPTLFEVDGVVNRRTE
jgi:hypothetical protein